MRPALFLDRDGVINEPVWDVHTGTYESPLSADDVRLVPAAVEAIRRANALNTPVVIVSNQPSAAKGLVSTAELERIHDRVLELLAADGATVTASYLCFHHPKGTVAELARRCTCRKPGPELLLTAARQHDLQLADSWMVGDTDADVGAAQAAGLGGVVCLTHPKSAHRRTGVAAEADYSTVSALRAIQFAIDRITATHALGA